MSQNEIKTRINEIDSKIAEVIKTFVLSSELKNLMEEKASLRAKCTHQFENGVCIYCGQEEK